jgi:hypothetical protein
MALCLRRPSNCSSLDSFSLISTDLPVVPTCRRRIACDVGQITGIFSRVSRPLRGAFRDRHKTLARDAVDATVQKTNAFVVDGEVVWS